MPLWRCVQRRSWQGLRSKLRLESFRIGRFITFTTGIRKTVHHREAWWPESNPRHREAVPGIPRDWSLPLSGSPSTSAFEPLFDYSFSILPETGYGSLNTTDAGNGYFLATGGTLTMNGGYDLGTYPVDPGGPGILTSPMGAFYYDNLLYPATANPQIDVDGLLFNAAGMEINIWGNSPGNYSYYDYSSGNYGVQLTEAGTFSLNSAPGGGRSGQHCGSEQSL